MSETKYILSIDAGGETGVALGRYSAETPFEVLDVWQVPNGLTGFKDWLFREVGYAPLINFLQFKMKAGQHYSDFLQFNPDSEENIVIAERFVPLAGQGFSHTSESVEPLRIEGALRAYGLMPDDYGDPRWQRPSAMVLHKVGTTAENKKASDDVLRHMGLWHTPKQLGGNKAKDVNAAMKHVVAYLKKNKHLPTLKAIKEAVE